MKKILITGGAGFLCPFLCEKLLGQATKSSYYPGKTGAGLEAEDQD
jgi:nucleoside-diphosphate-sugar epimerase